jgi:hypothetical protein
MKQRPNGQLAHLVLFTLRQPEDRTKSLLIEACKKYLKGTPGSIHFFTGSTAPINRAESDLDYHVAMLIIFESSTAHDIYQVSEQHLKFIEKNAHLWDKVRVIDFLVK